MKGNAGAIFFFHYLCSDEPPEKAGRADGHLRTAQHHRTHPGVFTGAALHPGFQPGRIDLHKSHVCGTVSVSVDRFRIEPGFHPGDAFQENGADVIFFSSLFKTKTVEIGRKEV